MLLKFKTISTALIFILTLSLAVLAQSILPVNSPSSAEIMRERIAKAKAFIVVKNYNAAIYELENIKRESADPALDSVINVLLMNSFLEQGDYKRAQDFLTGFAKDLNAGGKPNAAANYFAVAAQVIRCSRTQLERYHSIGLNVSDRTLPEAASTDVEKMRLTLEMVVDQSKALGKDKRYMDSAIALLDGATTARGNLAKDDYDANRWRLEAGDAREEMANSRTTIINAVNLPPVAENSQAAPTAEPKLNDSNALLLPVSNDVPAAPKKSETAVSKKPSGETVAKIEKPVADPPRQEPDKESEAAKSSPVPQRDRKVIPSAPKTEPADEQPSAETKSAGKQDSGERNDSPLDVGSLIGYATKRANPAYPSVARSMRMTGVVKVEVLLDEEGRVAEVQNADGPTLLQSAARDAIRKWQFKPFTRDGEPVKAVGFVSFSFNL